MSDNGGGPRRTALNLWALIAPPVLWAVHFLFCYLVAAVYCAKNARSTPLDEVHIAIAVATVLSLGLVLASGYLAWTEAQRAGDPPPHNESTDEDRARFLATAMLLLAGLSFAAIVFTAIAAVSFGDCR